MKGNLSYVSVFETYNAQITITGRQLVLPILSLRAISDLFNPCAKKFLIASTLRTAVLGRPVATLLLGPVGHFGSFVVTVGTIDIRSIYGYIRVYLWVFEV
uniref:Uncharacterized protein n=1 Tax=Candidatus Methanogaster sp. ANME-2c ERB4 TaxID=2759911 RepID=A0A7G9Y325_9EURY|nr:hypothetical protein ODADPOMJ_00002 [Methanosarcinales archaeon ANME-2c ERB4]